MDTPDRCPTCKSRNGRFNRGWNSWQCLEDHDKSMPDFAGYQSEMAAAANFPKTRSACYRNVPEQDDHQKYCMPKDLTQARLTACHQKPEIVERLRQWAKKPSGFALFAGPSGRGKTYAACAVINEYRANKGQSARFINVSDFYLLWKDCMRQYGDELDLILKYEMLDLVVLDDIGLRTPTDAFLEFLYIFVNKRKESQGGMIITTNLTSLSMPEKLGDAMFSRLCSGQIIKFEGKDQRLNKLF